MMLGKQGEECAFLRNKNKGNQGFFSQAERAVVGRARREVGLHKFRAKAKHETLPSWSDLSLRVFMAKFKAANTVKDSATLHGDVGTLSDQARRGAMKPIRMI